MLASKIAIHMAAVTPKQTKAAIKRAAKAVLATAPVSPPVREELPVHPRATVEHVTTAQLRITNRTTCPVAALIALFPPNAKDYRHPDEDSATAARRRTPPALPIEGNFAPSPATDTHVPRWLPATARITIKEGHAAALRALATQGNAYGPDVTRLARILTPAGQQAERTLVGRLSAVHQAVPDEMSHGVSPRGWTPLRMDSFPTT